MVKFVSLYPKLELFFVMIIIPCFVNAIQFLLFDQFLNTKGEMKDDFNSQTRNEVDLEEEEVK